MLEEPKPTPHKVSTEKPVLREKELKRICPFLTIAQNYLPESRGEYIACLGEKCACYVNLEKVYPPYTYKKRYSGCGLVAEKPWREEKIPL